MKASRVRVALAVLCVATLATIQQNPASDEGVTLITLDKTLQGKSLVLDKKEGLKLLDAQNKVTAVPLQNVVEVQYDRKSASPAGTEAGLIHVTLTNGDQMNGFLGKAAKDALTLSSDVFGEQKIPFELISMVYFPRKGYQKSKSRADDSKGDVIRLLTGDEDVGRVLSMGSEGLVFKSNKAPEATFAIKDVYEVYFEKISDPPPDLTGGAAVDILLTDGSRIRGILQDINAQTAKIQSVYYKNFGGALTVPVNKFETLNFNNSRVVYASDVNPSRVNEHPFVEAEGAHVFKFQRDRSVYAPDLPIRIKGRTYRKGLGVHAYSLLAYALDGQYLRFSATVGLDDTSDGLGSVIFRVYGDNKKLFESPRIVGTKVKPQKGDSTEPQLIDLDVSGVRELMLAVDFGDDDDVRDRAAWGNARLIKK